MREFLKKLAVFFGVGHLPKGPGTWGTLAALPFVFLISLLGPLFYMIFVVLLIFLAVKAAEVYQQDKEGHDHQEIVIDEVVGIFVTMTWLPMTWQAYLAGFLLFRVLDIFKPFPIGYLDKRIKGGFGVIADDLAAGIIASIILQVIYTKTMWLGVQVQ